MIPVVHLATGINNTSNTCGILSLVLLIPVANLPMSVGDSGGKYAAGRKLPLVSLILVVHLDLRISPQIF
jgi:hypothetical protein